MMKITNTTRPSQFLHDAARAAKGTKNAGCRNPPRPEQWIHHKRC
jgi:hypothetical protein